MYFICIHILPGDLLVLSACGPRLLICSKQYQRGREDMGSICLLWEEQFAELHASLTIIVVIAWRSLGSLLLRYYSSVTSFSMKIAI